MKPYLHLVSVLFVFVEGLVVVVVHHLHRLLRIGRHFAAQGTEIRSVSKYKCHTQAKSLLVNLIQRRIICMLGTQIRGVRAAWAFITYDLNLAGKTNMY